MLSESSESESSDREQSPLKESDLLNLAEIEVSEGHEDVELQIFEQSSQP